MRTIAPTPWRKSNGKPYVIVAANNRRICQVQFTSNPAIDIEAAKAESIATADLIAAAPDLLDALELALEVIEATGPGSYPEAESQIRKAINKAKEESHE